MDIFKKLALWFFSGVALVLGGWLTMSVIDRVPNEPDTIKNPPDLTIHDLKPSTVTERLTVVGQITNNSANTYRPVFVRLQVVHSGATLISCQQPYLTNVPPKSTLDFQMTCQDILTDRLPSGVAFIAKVDSALIE